MCGVDEFERVEKDIVGICVKKLEVEDNSFLQKLCLECRNPKVEARQSRVFCFNDYNAMKSTTHAHTSGGTKTEITTMTLRSNIIEECCSL